jgi:preprotein translocase SecE subunit
MLYRHKPEEGRNVRQTAFWMGMGMIVYGCYALSTWLDRVASLRGALLQDFPQIPILGLPLTGSNLIAIAVFLVATWIWVNYLAKVKTAEHLIEVEGEMKKVTWPSFREASNSSIVVVTTVLLLMAFLALSDYVLRGLFEVILWDRVVG